MLGEVPPGDEQRHQHPFAAGPHVFAGQNPTPGHQDGGSQEEISIFTVAVSGRSWSPVSQLPSFRKPPRLERVCGHRLWADQGHHPCNCRGFRQVKVAVPLLSQGFASLASRLLHAHNQVVIDSVVMFRESGHEQLQQAQNRMRHFKSL